MKVIDLLNKIANGKASDITTNFMFGREKYNLLRFLDTYALDINSLNFEVEILEEEKKIPEKIDIQIQNETTGNAYITNEQGTKCYLTKHSKIIAERLNQVIDYLQSKGE